MKTEIAKIEESSTIEKKAIITIEWGEKKKRYMKTICIY